MSCYTTSYPRIKGAPARMADGRAFTDYRTRCEQYPTKASGLWGEHDARQRMIADTQEFMNATKQLLNTKMGSVGCVDTMVPELYKRVCTYKGCTVQNGHYAGIGTGRIYNPNLAKAADDPQALAFGDTADLPGTFPIVSPDKANSCAAGDAEMFWQALAPKGNSIARLYPYSGPRGFTE